MFQKTNQSSQSGSAKIIHSICAFWLRKYKLVFFMIFFVLCIWGIALWYYSLYYFHWSNDQIKQYTDSQTHQTDLNEPRFEKALAGLHNREDVYQKPSEMVRNIFMTHKTKP